MDGNGRGRPLPVINSARGSSVVGGNHPASSNVSNSRIYNTRSTAARRGSGVPFRGLMPPPRPRFPAVSSTITRQMSVRKPGSDGSAAKCVVLDSKMSFPKGMSLSSPKYGEHLADLEANLRRLNEADNQSDEDEFGSPIQNDAFEVFNGLSPSAFANYYAEREAGLAVARAKGKLFEFDQNVNFTNFFTKMFESLHSAL